MTKNTLILCKHIYIHIHTQHAHKVSRARLFPVGECGWEWGKESDDPSQLFIPNGMQSTVYVANEKVT